MSLLLRIYSATILIILHKVGTTGKQRNRWEGRNRIAHVRYFIVGNAQINCTIIYRNETILQLVYYYIFVINMCLPVPITHKGFETNTYSLVSNCPTLFDDNHRNQS